MRILASLAFVVATSSAGCGFFASQAKTSVASTCQQSCANVPAEAQSDCQTRCQSQ